MSRFIRPSKYRHVFGQPGKKEYGYENVKVSNSAWDTNLISASGKYLSINWNASGGGAFAILPLPSPFNANTSFPSKLPDIIPLARSHTGPVLDTDWSPHSDNVVASGAEDGKVCIWKVEASTFDGWGAEGWEPRDFEPVARIDASPRKIGQVLFHPTAAHVLASASGEQTVKLWDLGSPEAAVTALTGHGDSIQNHAWNPTGTLLVTTCRDRKLRLFDPRAGVDAVRTVDGHGGIKGARVVWMGDRDRIATTGFSRMSDRQVGLWETGGLGNIKTLNVDQSSGVVMPFWSDNGILFLAGKGDGNVRYYEHESDTLHALDEHKTSDPQRGMCFLPRRALSVPDCEIARAYKIAGNTVEPIAFIVPRKSDSFQADIFPDAPSIEPSLTASEYFNGKDVALKLVSLDSGAVSTQAATSQPAYTPQQQHQPTRSASTPAPVPAPEAKAEMTPTVEPSRPAPAQAASSPVVEKAPPTPISAPQSSSSGDDGLKRENDRLNGELREARAKIRELELQVESMRANARKAAEALLRQ